MFEVKKGEFMIAFVSGIVRLIRTDSVVLDVHGVGYEVFISNALTQKNR